MKNLAIVVPLYNGYFFKDTLESLANQTNLNFTVYIGNDGGEKEIDNLVAHFSEKIKIKYRYFEKNMGQKSLTSHWHRCLSMIENEEWCWLLPDDDYLDKNCVSAFYEHLKVDKFDLFRFNIQFVDSFNNVFKKNPSLPQSETAFDSLINKLNFSRSSTVAEYIFSKKKFDEIGGFTDIPLAWGSDDLLWFQIGNEKGIFSTNKAFVYIRHSGLNISSNYKELASVKLKSSIIFLKKLTQDKFFKSAILKTERKNIFFRTAIDFIMFSLQDYEMKLNVAAAFRLSIATNKIWGGGIIKNFRRFILNNNRINK